MNTNQNHFNSEFAKNSPFGKVSVNSGLTVAIVLGQSVIDISQNVFANLGWDKITMPNPVFVGDTIYAESVVLEKRESKSRPYGGIVTAKTRGINQDGKTVIKWKRTFFVYKKDAPQDKDWFHISGSKFYAGAKNKEPGDYMRVLVEAEANKNPVAADYTKSVTENERISLFFWPLTNLKFDDWFWRPKI